MAIHGRGLVSFIEQQISKLQALEVAIVWAWFGPTNKEKSQVEHAGEMPIKQEPPQVASGMGWSVEKQKVAVVEHKRGGNCIANGNPMGVVCTCPSSGNAMGVFWSHPLSNRSIVFGCGFVTPTKKQIQRSHLGQVATHVANRFACYVQIPTRFPKDLAKIPGYTRWDSEPSLPKCLG